MDNPGFEIGTDGPRLILVGIDGSDTSLRAGAWAAGIARREGCALLVLHVTTTPPTIPAAPEAGAAWLQTRHEVAEQLRALVATESERLGFPAEFLTRHGNPYQELIAVADEHRVDAVVIGASMQAGHRFVGSLAARLVRDARWPVTVVP